MGLGSGSKGDGGGGAVRETFRCSKTALFGALSQSRSGELQSVTNMASLDADQLLKILE